MLEYTTEQSRHLAILSVCANDVTAYHRPQLDRAIKFEDINRLQELGFLEMEYATNTGAAPAKTFRLTEAGQLYHQMMVDKSMFERVDDVTRMRHYVIAGNARQVFPHVINLLTNGEMETREKIALCRTMLATDNGYLHFAANTYLDNSYVALQWLKTDTDLESRWVDSETGELTDGKPVNIRMTYAGFQALEQILGVVNRDHLRSYYRGRLGSAGHAIELALLHVASNIDDFLPYGKDYAKKQLDKESL